MKLRRIFPAVVAFSLFLLHQWAEQQGNHHKFIDGYLDDFLFLPLVYSSFSLLLSLAGKEPGWKFPWMWMLGGLVFTAAWFEGIAPVFHPGHIADPWDIFAYTMGVTCFAGWEKLFFPKKKTRKHSGEKPALI